MRPWLAAGCLVAGVALAGCAASQPAAPQPAAVSTTPAPTARTPAAARPAVPLAAPAPATPIPILMYHVIDLAPAHDPYAGLYVAPGLFAAQLAALRQAGYQAITLKRAYDIWQGRATPPPHPVVLSFDDGYVGVFEHAVPLLAGYGWPAVLNLQVGRLNVPGGLTTDQVRQMIAKGWEVDDHTITHPDLTRLPPARLHAEVAGAAARLRSLFGVPVGFFCYPAGRYDPAVVAAVRQAGFLGATTTWPGDAYPATEGYWTLDRVRVAGGEAPAALLAALRSYAARRPAAPPASFPPPAAKPRRPQATRPRRPQERARKL